MVVHKTLVLKGAGRGGGGGGGRRVFTSWCACAMHFTSSTPSAIRATNIPSTGCNTDNTLREAHHIEYALQLLSMIWCTCFYVLLTAVKDGLGCQQLSEYTADGPNVYRPHVGQDRTNTGWHKYAHANAHTHARMHAHIFPSLIKKKL